MLYVNSVFTRRIVGLSEAESDALLARLFNQVKRPEFQVALGWKRGIDRLLGQPRDASIMLSPTIARHATWSASRSSAIVPSAQSHLTRRNRAADMKLSLVPLRALALGTLLTLSACGDASSGADGTTLKVADQLHALKSSLDVAGVRPAHLPTRSRPGRLSSADSPIIAARAGGSIDVGWMAKPLVFAPAGGGQAGQGRRGQPVSEGEAGRLMPSSSSPARRSRPAADLKGKSVTFM